MIDVKKECVWVGEFKGGEPEGYCWFFENKYKVFKGNFAYGHFQGQGELKSFKQASEHFEYVGDFKESKFDGQGRMYWIDYKMRYDGNWRNSY